MGGFVAAWLIPAFGWQSVFVFGGAVPFVVALFMVWGLPESLQFLAVRQRSRATLVRWLRELDPRIRVDDSTVFVTHEQSRGGATFLHLFRDGRSLATVLLWVVNFLNLLVLYSVSNWLPTVVTGMGYGTGTASLVGGILQLGGTIGTFGLAWMIARGGFLPMLFGTYAVAAVIIALIGTPGISLVVLTLIVFLAGWCVIGGQPGINALSATFYPTYLRSTGIGWGLGIGRIGGIVGPYIGGILIGQAWTAQQLFWAAAVPACLTALTFIALMFTMRLPAQPSAPAPAPVAR